MYRVVVDLEMLRILNCGLGQLALRLGEALAQERPDDLALTFLVPPGTEHLYEEAGVDLLRAQRWQRDIFRRPLRPLAPLWGAPRIDLWHATQQFPRFWPFHPSVPTILTIHDLHQLREGSERKRRRSRRVLEANIRRATVITTGSNFAAGDIRREFDLGDKELVMIHDGASLGAAQASAPPAYAPRQPFLFAIGEVAPKKNFGVLVDLIARLPGYSLVIAGRKNTPYAAQIEERVRELGLTDRIHLPGIISDSDRYWLYQNCTALAFPSLGEGFGLPVIEAMSLGKPVFLSRETSLPEVGGPLAFYWHCFDAESMAEVFHQGMQTVARDPAYPDKLKAHAAYFNWNRAAREYLALYRRVAAAHAPLRRAA